MYIEHYIYQTNRPNQEKNLYYSSLYRLSTNSSWKTKKLCTLMKPKQGVECGSWVNAPFQNPALAEPTELEVTAPCHPLYGRRFPIFSIGRSARSAGFALVI